MSHGDSLANPTPLAEPEAGRGKNTESHLTAEAAPGELSIPTPPSSNRSGVESRAMLGWAAKFSARHPGCGLWILFP
jgi:hypothetical protein